MRQMVNIKKVSIDSELKVTATLEFLADTRQGKDSVFELIENQGNIVEVSFTPSQQALPMKGETEVVVFPMI
jgi:hypothetical protein